MSFFSYIVDSSAVWSVQLLKHLYIILLSLPLSVMIGVPLGIYIASHNRVAKVVIRISSILITIPSLALFGIMVVLLSPFNASLGTVPAVITLVLYSLLPLVRNTMIAMQSVSHSTLEAARGIGMTKKQILFHIRLPLSLPILLSGIRNVLVMGVGVITMAQLVGAGGLGYFLFTGLSRSRVDMIALGALLVTALGLSVNYLMIYVEDKITPLGLKIRGEKK